MSKEARNEQIKGNRQLTEAQEALSRKDPRDAENHIMDATRKYEKAASLTAGPERDSILSQAYHNLVTTYEHAMTFLEKGSGELVKIIADALDRFRPEDAYQQYQHHQARQVAAAVFLAAGIIIILAVAANITGAVVNISNYTGIANATSTNSSLTPLGIALTCFIGGLLLVLKRH